MADSELWRLVFPYLSQPIPAPLSAPARGAIRQSDLVNLLKTCKLFKDIATPLIYTHLITDDLALLLQAEDLPSRLPYFLHTKSLRIEYLAKQGAPYHELCAENMWARQEAWSDCGPTEERRLAMRESEAKWEVKELTRMLDTNTTPLSTIFPYLETIMVGSIYGSDSEVWEPLVVRGVLEEGKKTPLQACGRKFADFVQGGTATHICYRDALGPLSLPHYYLSRNPSPHTTVHFLWAEGAALPVRYGSPQRWLFDGSRSSEWTFGLSVMGHGLQLVRETRWRLPFWRSPLDLQITYSTSTSGRPQFDANYLLFRPTANAPRRPNYVTVTPSVQIARAGQLEKALREHFSKGPDGKVLPLQDHIRWESCVDAEPCAACGVGPPA